MSQVTPVAPSTTATDTEKSPILSEFPHLFSKYDIVEFQCCFTMLLHTSGTKSRTDMENWKV